MRMAAGVRRLFPAGALAAAVAAMVAAAVALAACGRDTPLQQPSVPAAAVVSVAPFLGDSDEATRALEAGLAAEAGRWLSHASDVAIRGGGDADHTVRLGLRPSDPGWVARWEVATSGAPPQADSTAVTSAQMAAFPRALALQLFAHVSSDTAAHTLLGAAPDPSPADAYVELLRLLGAEEGGAPASGQEKARHLLVRARALDSLAARLADAPSAELALGAKYLELAGLVSGTEPYYDLAGQHLAKAVEMAPGLPSAREKLASYNTKLGRSEEALALLVQGLARHPSHAGFHDARGYLLRYAGWTRESIAAYRRAQELDPRPGNQVSTQDQITKSHVYLGEYAEALASHERVEALLARWGRPATEKEHFYESVIHLYAGDREAAVAAFREGRAVDPTTVWSTFGEGYEAIALGDRDRVAGVLERLETLGVVDGERHYRLVHFAAFLGEPEHALEHLKYSISAGFFASPYFETDPLTERLRSYPGFQPLLARAAHRHAAFLSHAPSGDRDDGNR